MVQGEFQDILGLFSGILNFNIRQFKRIDGEWGTLNKETGEWNGMISNLKNEEADMITSTLGICCRRTEAIDFLWPLASTTYGFGIKSDYFKLKTIEKQKGTIHLGALHKLCRLKIGNF